MPFKRTHRRLFWTGNNLGCKKACEVVKESERNGHNQRDAMQRDNGRGCVMPSLVRPHCFVLLLSEQI
jgi:hypothetical protein